MLDEIERELDAFRIHFDSWVLQREMEREVPEGLPEIETYEADGTLWARTSEARRRQGPAARPLVGRLFPLLRRRHRVRPDKFERGFERLIYVLGADHHGYVARLKAAAAMLGYDPDRLEVLIYQLVHLVEGGQAKISKRRGDVVFLDDLIDEIGVDAARWFLVYRGPDQAIEIDVDLARERARRTPSTTSSTRTRGSPGSCATRATRRSRRSGRPRAGGAGPRQAAGRLPGVVREAIERRAPHAVPEYAIGLADDFHRFYHHHRVLESEQQAFRLGLVKATQVVLARSLDLVGVEAPERM